ncbi:DUF3231 family protein [Oceanobacillus manasiensis]|uniref:DUF3231 family protein n=1 Tax=Oceanobacillus manasiensis TaxID=586413 RepID=UPI0005A5DDAD|nr:DUF3231 family protein [Oceanobacillus manasiensis]
MGEKQITKQLTASEISNLWAIYQNNTVAKVGLSYFLEHVEDQDIKVLLEECKSLAEQELGEISAFFRADNYPIPKGFTEEDVQKNAPRLFSDSLYLEYIFNMFIISLNTYSTALSVSERQDIVQFFSKCLDSAKKLHLNTKELTKRKGLYTKKPVLPVPAEIEFVKKDSFLSGWFGKRRPLLGMEISNLNFHSQRNALGHALITGFSQVATSKELRSFFEKGRDISEKHLSIFTTLLRDDNMDQGSTMMTSEVTTSTTAPFSDKFMMYIVTALINSSIGQYGVSLSTSPRHDLALQYTRLIADISKYANESANILIDKGWMEQPPIAADRKELAK